MCTSSFFGSNQFMSPKGKDSTSKLIKQFNLKEESEKKENKKVDMFMKTFDGSSNLLSQFSSKLKEPSHIQKKTYWKGTNNKNFSLNVGDKDVDKINEYEGR